MKNIKIEFYAGEPLHFTGHTVNYLVDLHAPNCGNLIYAECVWPENCEDEYFGYDALVRAITKAYAALGYDPAELDFPAGLDNGGDPNVEVYVDLDEETLAELHDC